MYCHKCGARIPSGAKFCAKCGAKVLEGSSIVETSIHTSAAINSPLNALKRLNESTIQLVEGALSIFLAILALFAPVVKVIYDTGYDTESMLHVARNLSTFRFPGRYAPIGPILGILMVFASVGSLINAKQALGNEIPEPKYTAGGIRVSNSCASLVTVYAIALIVLLGVAAGNAYGIAGCSGWAWFLLFGGVANQVVHFVRCSSSATRIS